MSFYGRAKQGKANVMRVVSRSTATRMNRLGAVTNYNLGHVPEPDEVMLPMTA